MAFDLKKVIRALLYSSNQPLPIKDVQAAFSRFHESGKPAAGDSSTTASGAGTADDAGEGSPEDSGDPDLYQNVPSLVTATQIRAVMDEIAAELRSSDQGLILIEGSSGYRLVTHPRFARWVRILRAEPHPTQLSAAALETLAIVAYRQPVTRTEIEAIRGVSVESALNRLIERELVHITGRAELPGRPLQYGTSDAFLEYSGLKSLDELPASDVLSARQLDDWLKSAMNPSRPGDADMGLPEEQLPLEPAAAEGGAQPTETAKES